MSRTRNHGCGRSCSGVGACARNVGARARAAQGKRLDIAEEVDDLEEQRISWDDYGTWDAYDPSDPNSYESRC